MIVHRGTEVRQLSTVSVPVLAGSLVLALALTYTLGTLWLGWLLVLGPAAALAQGIVLSVLQNLLKAASAVVLVRSGALDVQRP